MNSSRVLRSVPTLLLLVLTPALTAQAPGSHDSSPLDPTGPTLGPVISGYGPVFQIPMPEMSIPEGTELRIALDLVDGSTGPEELNRGLVTAARFLNMHAQAGIDRERLRVAVVVHGSAAKDVLADPAHRDQTGHDNPNLPLIQELAAAGVRIIMCGQSMASRGLPRDGLADSVEVALSAMTAHLLLQEEGYRVNPF